MTVMADPSVLVGRPLGGMVPDPALLTSARETDLVRADGRPKPEFRDRLRTIPSWRNAWSVVWVWLQAAIVVGLAVWWGNPVGYVVAFLLMGRTQAQLAALMHEAAHRLLFANRRANDLVGRWFLGYPSFTSTDAYRRVHMAHHRQEFGPDEPDIPLYAGYPITRDSLRRKLVRDATGRTGFKLMRAQFAGFRSPDRARPAHPGEDPGGAGGAARDRRRRRPVVALPVVLARALPDRLAGDQPPALDRRARWHGRVDRSPCHDPHRPSVVVVAQRPGAVHDRLAPRRTTSTRACRCATCRSTTARCTTPGYVTPGLEYPGYRALWRALRAGTPTSSRPST